MLADTLKIPRVRAHVVKLARVMLIKDNVHPARGRIGIFDEGAINDGTEDDGLVLEPRKTAPVFELAPASRITIGQWCRVRPVLPEVYLNFRYPMY